MLNVHVRVYLPFFTPPTPPTPHPYLQRQPEIMIPLTSTCRELEHIMPQVRAAVQQTFDARGASCPFRLGTMIEIPRACLTADAIAPLVDFMSFGTNDLTQMCFGFSVRFCNFAVWGVVGLGRPDVCVGVFTRVSHPLHTRMHIIHTTQRDDISHFLPIYLEKKILKADPFVQIDQEVRACICVSRSFMRQYTDSLNKSHISTFCRPTTNKPPQGVGQLIKMTIDRSKAVKGGIQYGVCGEQGGEPNSVAFFHKVRGFNLTLSCDV